MVGVLYLPQIFVHLYICTVYPHGQSLNASQIVHTMPRPAHVSKGEYLGLFKARNCRRWRVVIRLASTLCAFRSVKTLGGSSRCRGISLVFRWNPAVTHHRTTHTGNCQHAMVERYCWGFSKRLTIEVYPSSILWCTGWPCWRYGCSKEPGLPSSTHILGIAVVRVRCLPY